VNRPVVFSRIEYVIVEPSPTRQKWQQKTLDEFAGKILWVPDLKNLRVRGVIFSNELLDAFPVHRLAWDKKENYWAEWGVTKKEDEFVWAKIATPRQGISPIEKILPDGYTIEINLAALQWWREAAQALVQGRLMTIDYGLTKDELFSPTRLHGTVRGYRDHRPVDNVLLNPGEVDITAHVNFFAVQSMGESCDLKTEALDPQSKFLTQIVAQISAGDEPWKWTPERARQLQTLVHPEHLGRAFRVLIQSRG
jgi:SAM-dependent MidA family methyltransferase